MAPFATSEYESRWKALRAEAERRGLAGAVVVSRGGAQVDSYADVFYLSNHYNAFPLLADRPPHWSGHSHCAFVLALEGEPTLVDSFGEYRPDLVAVEDARVSSDLPAGVAAVLAEKGLDGADVGLVAGNSMLMAPGDRLRSLAGATRFVACDDMVEGIRARKSSKELERLRAAAAVGEEIMRRIMRAAVRAGCTEAEAVAEGYKHAVSQGVAMYDAAVASGPHRTRYTYGRLPSWSTRKLESGDIFHVDLYGSLDGYMFDFSRTAIVGRPPDPEQREVLEGTAAAIDSGISVLAPGLSGSEVFECVRRELVDRGLVEEQGGNDDPEGFAGYACHGHGLGLWWEAPWIAPWETQTIEPNMVIAIECMAGREDVGLVKLEQNAIVGEGAADSLLTLPPMFTVDTL